MSTRNFICLNVLRSSQILFFFKFILNKLLARDNKDSLVELEYSFHSAKKKVRKITKHHSIRLQHDVHQINELQ